MRKPLMFIVLLMFASQSTIQAIPAPKSVQPNFSFDEIDLSKDQTFVSLVNNMNNLSIALMDPKIKSIFERVVKKEELSKRDQDLFCAATGFRNLGAFQAHFNSMMLAVATLRSAYPSLVNQKKGGDLSLTAFKTLLSRGELKRPAKTGKLLPECEDELLIGSSLCAVLYAIWYSELGYDEAIYRYSICMATTWAVYIACEGIL